MSPRVPLMGLLCTLVGLFAPVYMLLFIWLICWDSEPSYVQGRGPDDAFDPSFVKRGDLPSWLRWAQTGDMRLPGGMYEPAIKAAVGGGALWRRIWASYIWLGLRNRAQGLAYLLGHDTTDYIPDPFSTDRDRSNWVQGGNVWTFSRGYDWQQWRRLGPVFLITGYQVYKLLDGTFRAVPVFTFKRG